VSGLLWIRAVTEHPTAPPPPRQTLQTLKTLTASAKPVRMWVAEGRDIGGCTTMMCDAFEGTLQKRHPVYVRLHPMYRLDALWLATALLFPHSPTANEGTRPGAIRERTQG
jgi:hypothetical protein